MSEVADVQSEYNERVDALVAEFEDANFSDAGLRARWFAESKILHDEPVDFLKSQGFEIHTGFDEKHPDDYIPRIVLRKSPDSGGMIEVFLTGADKRKAVQRLGQSGWEERPPEEVDKEVWAAMEKLYYLQAKTGRIDQSWGIHEYPEDY